MPLESGAGKMASRYRTGISRGIACMFSSSQKTSARARCFSLHVIFGYVVAARATEVSIVPFVFNADQLRKQARFFNHAVCSWCKVIRFCKIV